MHKPAVRLLNHRGGSAQLTRFRRSFWGGIFSMTEGAVKMRYTRAIKLLRDIVEE
jgi:hypothetical protein